MSAKQISEMIETVTGIKISARTILAKMAALYAANPNQHGYLGAACDDGTKMFHGNSVEYLLMAFKFNVRDFYAK